MVSVSYVMVVAELIIGPTLELKVLASKACLVVHIMVWKCDSASVKKKSKFGIEDDGDVPLLCVVTNACEP